jgi:uncharacterized delta-60 repeat protein
MHQPSSDRRFRPPVLLFALLALFLTPVQTVFGQQGFPGTVDPTFASNQSGITRAGNVQALALQPDGKTVIAGLFFGVDDRRRIALARVNADGSVDTTFGENLAGVDGSVASLAIQPDGKILVAGSFPTINGVARGNIARVNADGSTDTSFGAGLAGTNVGIQALALQPDGKILIGGFFTSVNGVSVNRIARLNADGSLDTGFGNGLAGANNPVSAIALQSDGKIVIGGTFTSVNGTAVTRLARLNADGTLDGTFAPNLTGASVSVVLVQSDGKIVIGGSFSQIGGQPRANIGRLNADGSLDAGFGNGLAGANNIVNVATLQPDGKIFISGFFTTVNGTARNRIARLNSDGSLDTAFNPALGDRAQSAVRQSDGRFILGGQLFATGPGVFRRGVARINADGTLDTSFGAGGSGAGGFGSMISRIQELPDGKIMVSGQFEAANGLIRAGVARLNADGTTDATFDAGTLPEALAGLTYFDFAFQTDGRILVAGNFPTFAGNSRIGIARIQSNGAYDATFLNGLSGPNGPVTRVAVLPDGDILIAGNFTQVNGTPRTRVARLNPDGTLDETSTVGSIGPENTIFAMRVQTDGKILIGGVFDTVGGVGRPKFARLNADGTLDTTFAGGITGTASFVRDFAIQPDGRVIVGGDFSILNGVAVGGIARINLDGTLDTTYGGLGGANTGLVSLALQPDGKLVIGGDFSTVNGVTRRRLARLNADGTLDTLFGNGLSGPDGIVQALALQSDGRILGGGQFFRINGTPRTSIARLFADPGPAVNVNANVSLVVTGQTLTPATCPADVNNIVLTATLTNIGATPLFDPYFEVIELQKSGANPPPSPFHLLSANGATCGSGGLVGSQQSVGAPGFILQPGQSVQVTFTIGLPQLSRFRFFVNVFAFVNQSNRSARLNTISKKAGPGFELRPEPFFADSPGTRRARRVESAS